jgi:predicted transcriptional regulator
MPHRSGLHVRWLTGRKASLLNERVSRKQSVNRIEGGGMDARFSTMNALADALRSAGVEMGEGASTGVVRVSIVRDRIVNDSPADETRS